MWDFLKPFERGRLADKNRDLAPEFIEQILAGYGIDPERLILTQISRFDRLTR